MLFSLLALALGLGLITWSAEKFILGASNLAYHWRVNPALVGLSLVAIGTSAPEALVAIIGAMHNSNDLAVGNVIGSNITNIGLILGICASIRPIKVPSKLLAHEYPFLIVATICMCLLLLNQQLNYVSSSLLLVGLMWFLWRLYQQSKHKSTIKVSQALTMTLAIIYVIAGIIIMPVSARVIVVHAVNIAQLLGLSEMIIGLTIVAIGTSLPEIVTSISATMRNEHGLLIGSIVGSNLFNILAVMPLPGLINPGLISINITKDLFMLTAITLLLLYLTNGKSQISRKGGALLLMVYLGYMLFAIYYAIWPSL